MGSEAVTDLQMYQLENDGAVFWVVAHDHVEAVDLVLRKHFEPSGETPGTLSCEVAKDQRYTFDLGPHGVQSLTPDEWVSWADEPEFLASSEY